jgi:hypothetical protein
VANPLGVTVVTCVETALRPAEDAEMEVVPGVVLVVKLATAKPSPRRIMTSFETVPTLSWEEVRKTTVSLRAREALAPEVSSETTMAG